MGVSKSKCYNWFAVFIATGGGAGFARRAPGTAGTAFAIPLLISLDATPTIFKVFFWSILSFLGIWAAGIYDHAHGTQDNPRIVIDEILGFALATSISELSWQTILLAFVLFRYFDIRKVFPTNIVDIWSKHQTSQINRGFGIIADDLVAGLQTLSVLYIFKNYFNFP